VKSKLFDVTVTVHYVTGGAFGSEHKASYMIVAPDDGKAWSVALVLDAREAKDNPAKGYKVTFCEVVFSGYIDGRW
jgi:hypothetical protein